MKQGMSGTHAFKTENANDVRPQTQTQNQKQSLKLVLEGLD
jgi:hypothetical protein